MNSKKKITIQDIASELNLSLATVSRAFNNHPYVSDDVKKRVTELADKYNYRPSSIASSLRRGKTKTVGIIIPRNNRHFFSNVIFSIESVMAKAGYNTMICQSLESYDKENNSIKMLTDSNVSGIIISHSNGTKNGDHLKQAIEKGIKVMQFDRVLEDIDTSYVKNDNIKGAKTTVLHMLEQGYRRIAFFHGNLSTNVFKDRKKGYLEAYKGFGIEPDKKLFFNNTITREQGENVTQKMLDDKLDFDAIYSCGDYSALGAYLKLKENGVKTPEDVGVAGFASEPFTEFTSPSITSTDQNSQEMGKIIAEQLLKEIEVKNTSKLQITIPTIPKLRESTQRIIITK